MTALPPLVCALTFLMLASGAFDAAPQKVIVYDYDADRVGSAMVKVPR